MKDGGKKSKEVERTGFGGDPFLTLMQCYRKIKLLCGGVRGFMCMSKALIVVSWLQFHLTSC